MSGQHHGHATFPVPPANPGRHRTPPTIPIAGYVALAALPLFVGGAMLIGPLVGAPAADPAPVHTSPTLSIPHTPLLRTP